MTICVKDGECLFGSIVDDEMVLNSFGQIVDEEWQRVGDVREQVLLDMYRVMPNHFHGIVFLLNELEPDPKRTEQGSVRATRALPLVQRVVSGPNRPRGPEPDSLGAVIGGFKSVSTRRINKLGRISGNSIWQRNYWERIIRNES